MRNFPFLHGTFSLQANDMLLRSITKHLIPKKNSGISYSTSSILRNASKKGSSPLAELRKKSGYPLSLCKKALSQNDQNVDLAFKWLQVSLIYIVDCRFLKVSRRTKEQMALILRTRLDRPFKEEGREQTGAKITCSRFFAEQTTTNRSTAN